MSARPFKRVTTAELFRLLKTGPSAVTLPSNVTKLTLSPAKSGPGAAGLRHFVREYLPALKFNNIQVPITRKVAEPGPSTITVELEGSRAVKVDVTNVHSKQILPQLLNALKSEAGSSASA